MVTCRCQFVTLDTFINIQKLLIDIMDDGFNVFETVNGLLIVGILVVHLTL
ncbi:hypothetical protein D3C74_497260 [compost metagenome]